jgi:hypothetical protein
MVVMGERNVFSIENPVTLTNSAIVASEAVDPGGLFKNFYFVVDEIFRWDNGQGADENDHFSGEKRLQ